MSHMSVSYIRSISTSTNVLVTFIFFPKLSLNLLSIGKLYQVSLEVHFTNNNYDAHDPQMGQLLGTSHNVGFLFEFSSLPAPSHLSSSTIDATISLRLVALLFRSCVSISCNLEKQTYLPFNKSESLLL